MDPSTVKIIFTNKTDCEFTGRFTENKFDGNDKKEELNTVMSVKMAGQNGAKQIIRADAEFTGTVEVESGTLIMHSTAALGKLTMTGGGFGGIDGGVKVSEAEWLGGDIVFHNAEAFMGGSPDKITVDGTFAKTGEGKIGVDFSELDASIFVEDGNLVFGLITANALEGFPPTPTTTSPQKICWARLPTSRGPATRSPCPSRKFRNPPPSPLYSARSHSGLPHGAGENNRKNSSSKGLPKSPFFNFFAERGYGIGCV